MSVPFYSHLRQALEDIASEGLEKIERPLISKQSAHVNIQDGDTTRSLINLCANNYLGLADDERLAKAAMDAIESHGLGMASVRFICGTQELHRVLEKRLAEYLGTEDSILFAACFDANGGLFEPLLGPQDAIVSDALNHASIIDGIRLSKAKRYRYANNDMSALEDQLKSARADGARHIMIATDGVFSMDGYLADLKGITQLAVQYDAQVMVDDCHATGFMGPQGRGTPHLAGVADQVDILTGTFGKALGGALGGYVAGAQEVVDMLRQRARPYLFSNALPPMVVGAAIKAIDIAEAGDDLRSNLFSNAAYWRAGLERAGFDVLPGQHPIIPVMLGDASLAQRMAAGLNAKGVYVSGFFFPVVPKGQARIRTQMNAALTTADLDEALEAFSSVGRSIGVI